MVWLDYESTLNGNRNKGIFPKKDMFKLFTQIDNENIPTAPEFVFAVTVSTNSYCMSQLYIITNTGDRS